MTYPSPFSSPDGISDDDWNQAAAQWRAAQGMYDPLVAGPLDEVDLGPGFDPTSPAVGAALGQAQMPHGQWQAARAAQLAANGLSGGDTYQDGASDVQGADSDGAKPIVLAATSIRPPLTGRPGPAAAVAGAINTIVARPNSHAQVPGTGFQVNRGAGNDIHAQGAVHLPSRAAAVLGDPSVGVEASGTLAPPSSRPEVSVTNIHARPAIGSFASTPDRVRVYNTPSGELDYDVHPGLSFSLPWPLSGLPAIPILRDGTYVIGTPDLPKKK